MFVTQIARFSAPRTPRCLLGSTAVSPTASTPAVLPQVAVNLRAALAAASMSREQLAGMIGVSFYTVRTWESGTRLPHGKNLVTCCEALGVSPGWLYTDHSSSQAVA